MKTCYNIKLTIVFIIEIIFFIISPLHINAQQNASDMRVLVHDIRQENRTNIYKLIKKQEDETQNYFHVRIGDSHVDELQ